MGQARKHWKPVNAERWMNIEELRKLFIEHLVPQKNGCLFWYNEKATRLSWYGRGVSPAGMAWHLFRGDQGNLFVCHTCDEPRCCNVNHLWLGTAQENTNDMWYKGRQSFNLKEFNRQRQSGEIKFIAQGKYRGVYRGTSRP
jgi:hypothetical protein